MLKLTGSWVLVFRQGSLKEVSLLQAISAVQGLTQLMQSLLVSLKIFHTFGSLVLSLVGG